MFGSDRSQKFRTLSVALAAAALIAGPAADAQSGAIHLDLKTAAGATELPAPAWGSYSSGHSGPTYLASRKLSPLLAFPIVVGQQRDEILRIGSRAIDGKPLLRPEPVTLLRRATGLSPATGADAAGRPVVARIVQADADGLLTAARALFPPAGINQDVIKRSGGAANSAWPAGECVVSWSPAYSADGAEGLIVRAVFTNRGAAPQAFFIDLFGGLDRPDPLFDLTDLSTDIDADGRGVVLSHKKMAVSMALSGQHGDWQTRSYAVPAEVFGPGAAACRRDAAGAALPTGAGAPGAAWALTRISGIAVEAGASQTVVVSVGLGKDAESALTSARTLLSLADNRKGGDSLLTLADRAHEKASFHSGSATIDRLMAQSLVNIPFHDVRRVGVVSREGGAYYQPGIGGWMALGWSGYRPDWSASQLNAWFVTESGPHKLVGRIVTNPPTDLFVMWDLFQRTHDRDMLERFYPYAVWRFREFVESGREREDSWLFAWPLRNESAALAAADTGAAGAPGTRPGAVYAPDYSAYVILSARILQACSKFLERPADEQMGFSDAAEKSMAALSKHLWDADRRTFVTRQVSSIDAVVAKDPAGTSSAGSLSNLLPYIAGVEQLTEEQETALHAQLSDPVTFLSPAGLRSVSAKSASYQPADGTLGGVRFGAQWLFWKSMLDRGDSAQASALAASVVAGYENAAIEADICPEWLNGDTGKGLGRPDSAGEACAVIALHAAYHRSGSVSAGWDLNLLDDHYDAAADSLRIVFRSVAKSPHGVVLCAMAKAGAKYRATGGITGDFVADGTGVVALPVPKDPTTQQVNLAPVGATP